MMCYFEFEILWKKASAHIDAGVADPDDAWKLIYISTAQTEKLQATVMS